MQPVRAKSSAVTIRGYRPDDKYAIASMFNDFQDFLASVDSMHRLAGKAKLLKAGYGSLYMQKTLKGISKNKGCFYVAEDKGRIIGFVVGLVYKPNRLAEIEQKRKRRNGEITELYVESTYRGRGLGKKLLLKAEVYLKQNGCNDSFLWVLAQNTAAHKFYARKMGYADRGISMLKRLK